MLKKFFFLNNFNKVSLTLSTFFGVCLRNLFIAVPNTKCLFLFSILLTRLPMWGQQTTTMTRPSAPCATQTAPRTSRTRRASMRIPRTPCSGSSRRRLKSFVNSLRTVSQKLVFGVLFFSQTVSSIVIPRNTKNLDNIH